MARSDIDALNATFVQGLEKGDARLMASLHAKDGRYELRAGNQVVDTGKYVVVHRRQSDGSWKYGIDIWNSDQAPPS